MRSDEWEETFRTVDRLVRARYPAKTVGTVYGPDDVVQDVMVRAWRYRETTNTVPSGSLLATMVDRTIVDVLRKHGPMDKHRRPRPVLDPVKAGYPDVETVLATVRSRKTDMTTVVDRIVVTAAMVDRLPPRERYVVVRSAYGYSHAEIAETLGVSESRVSQILASAQQKLRSYQEDQHAHRVDRHQDVLVRGCV